ncbi:RDD family protein [Flammeovirga pacifica]|uniref:RDD domain-containing protein n=1 Tax=Flammeovirga pacifica TaxID=915059 RepID=A0A1S1Z2J9_FLAPC|nr:hypothetical protein [Flammeovirga pacifica]OHX67504.1 hypothetical protein NH26_14685 [Flammeovirga pacifica]
MNLQKVLLLLLIIVIPYDLYYINIPYWITDFQFPSVRDVADLINQILTLVSITYLIVGIYQVIKIKKLELTPAFKFPLYINFIQSFFWFIITLFSPNYSFFILIDDLTLFNSFIIYTNRILLLATIIYFFKNQRVKVDKENETPQLYRAFILMIDSLLILNYYLLHFHHFSGGFIFDQYISLELFNYIFFLVFYFSYYFMMEVIFLQTIGKLPFNAYVSFNGNRVVSILLRTLFRGLPFDKISFLGDKKGWHDRFSNTTVISES